MTSRGTVLLQVVGKISYQFVSYVGALTIFLCKYLFSYVCVF